MDEKFTPIEEQVEHGLASISSVTSPAYHGFDLVEETRTDGWCYGAITVVEEPGGCVSGDGFVVAPDGSRAGIVWEVGDQEIEVILPPD